MGRKVEIKKISQNKIFFSDTLLEMTQLLVEEQPVPDDENARKPALLKHHSIILTEDELKELGMKDHLSENVITCEIAEEEEISAEAECDEEATPNDQEENQSTVKELDNGESNHEHDQDIGDGDTCNETDDITKENETEKPEGEEIEENKIDGSDIENVEESNEIEQNETEGKTDIETVEVKVEDEKPKEPEKPPEVKPKTLTRPISGHKFKIPAMWCPANPRANAAFVYIYFRQVLNIFTVYSTSE